MAEREVRVKLATEADMSGVEDLENTLDNLKEKTVPVRPEVELTELEEVEAEIDKLQQKMADIYLGVDDTPFEEVEAELDKLEARRIELTVDVDDSALDSLEDKTVTIRPEIESMELDEVESRIDELQQKMADIYLGIDDTQLEEVEAELDELEARQIELTVNMDSSGVDEASSGLNNTEESANNATSALEIMAGLQIGETLAQWGVQAEGFAQSLDNMAISTEQLAIQTGMTDSQMTGMLNNITNATFPREEALMYVQSLDQIGVSAQNLGASATGLDKINDAFHMGAPAVNKLGQELSVLGVDMNNVSSSYNALAYANANTVGGMENFSKFLTRFDADFNQLGLNVDQAAVAIAGATHKFGGGRAALTGMSSALKECNGDLGQLEQSLGLEAGALQNASNLTGKYNGQLDQMAAKEGQHKTLTQQLAAALDDVTASFTGVLAPFSSFLGLMGQLGSGAVSANALLTLPENLGKAVGFIKKLEIGTKAYSVAETIANGVRAVATGLQNALNASMLANPILLLVAALAVLIGYMVYLYQTNEQCRQSVNQLGADLQRVASGDYSGLKDVGNDLMAASDSFAQASGFAALIGEENYNRWVELRNGMLQAFTDMLGGAGEQLTLFGEQLGNIFNQAGLSVQNFGIWISQTFMQVITTIQQFCMQILMIPVNIASAITQGIAQFQAFLPQVSGVLAGVIGVVAGWAGNLIGQFGSAASNAVSAFASNFTGIASAVAGELGAMVSTAISYCQQLLDTLRNAAAEAVNLWKTITGEKSPGYIYEAFKGELDAMVNVASDFKVPSIMGDNAQSMVDNWGNPSLALDTGVNSGTSALGGGVTMNIVINGDVDSEERMEKFADYIINRMTWDNETANRTV